MPVVQPPVSNLKEAWETFIERGELLSEVPLLVAQAWQRCRQLGVDP